MSSTLEKHRTVNTQDGILTVYSHNCVSTVFALLIVKVHNYGICQYKVS